MLGAQLSNINATKKCGFPYSLAMLLAGGDVETCGVGSIARVRQMIDELCPQAVTVLGNTPDECEALYMLNGRAH